MSSQSLDVVVLLFSAPLSPLSAVIGHSLVLLRSLPLRRRPLAPVICVLIDLRRPCIELTLAPRSPTIARTGRKKQIRCPRPSAPLSAVAAFRSVLRSVLTPAQFTSKPWSQKSKKLSSLSPRGVQLISNRQHSYPQNRLRCITT